MKLPKLMSGWVTSDRKVHDTREEATSHEIKERMREMLTEIMRQKMSIAYGVGLYPDEVVEVILKEFHVEPKLIEGAGK
jgi:hypothetical protein